MVLAATMVALAAASVAVIDSVAAVEIALVAAVIASAAMLAAVIDSVAVAAVDSAAAARLVALPCQRKSSVKAKAS